MSDLTVVVPGELAVDTVTAAAMGRLRDRDVQLVAPFRVDLVVFRHAPAHTWPQHEERWIDATLQGLFLANAITSRADVVRFDFRLTATVEPPRAHITVRSLADLYR